MSDSEMCYRESLHEKMAANNLMCYFHVKQDSKMYLLKHHKASQEEKANAWRQVASDIDVIRGALNEEDLRQGLQPSRRSGSQMVSISARSGTDKL